MLPAETLLSFEQLYEKWRCAEAAACHAEDHAWANYRACCQASNGVPPATDAMVQAARLRSEASHCLMEAMAQVWSHPL